MAKLVSRKSDQRPRRPFLRRTFAAGCIGLLASIGTAACGSDGAEETSPPESVAARHSDEQSWSGLVLPGATDVEGFAFVRQMADSADAVAVGSFTPFSEGRTVQGDAPEDVVSFAATTFVPTTVIKGAVPDEGVPMEFTLPVAPGESTSAIRQLNIDGPTGPVLVFLRRRPDGLWRQVSSLGIWASTERSPIDTPMSDEVAANGVFRDELAEVASLDQLAAYVSG